MKIYDFEDFLNSEITEKSHYTDEKIRKEYLRSVAPQLRKGEDPAKKDLKKFFDIHKEKMAQSLDEDEKNVTKLCDSEIERLNGKLNEGETDSAKQKKIQEKIKKIEAYKEAQLKDIKESKKKYNQFFNSNPKIIIN
jgi:flagellar motility protein MotE (MotC chaperone)